VVNIEVLDERPCYHLVARYSAANYAMEYVVYRNHNEIYTDITAGACGSWTRSRKSTGYMHRIST